MPNTQCSIFYLVLGKELCKQKRFCAELWTWFKAYYKSLGIFSISSCESDELWLYSNAGNTPELAGTWQLLCSEQSFWLGKIISQPQNTFKNDVNEVQRWNGKKFRKVVWRWGTRHSWNLQQTVTLCGWRNQNSKFPAEVTSALW